MEKIIQMGASLLVLGLIACYSSSGSSGTVGFAGSSGSVQGQSGANNNSPGGTGGGGGGGAGAGGEGGASGSAGGPPKSFDFSFAPSNVPAAIKEESPPSTPLNLTLKFTKEAYNTDCFMVVNTDSGEWKTNPNYPYPLFKDAYHFKAATQKEGPDVGVFMVKSLLIEENCGIYVYGSRPFVLVAAGDVTINGTVVAVPNEDLIYKLNGAGGYPIGSNGGPGAGGPSPQPNFGTGGGASHCTKGGKGSGDTAGQGGNIYGNEQISPLLGGSLGGHAAYSNTGGGLGGGAIQISAGGTIAIGPKGSINVGGGGGGLPGGTYGQGGGSGGSLLLEAPVITILGALAANGGSGSGNKSGKAGGVNDIPVGSFPQGYGAAGDKDATDGTQSSGIYDGGGGGGAGRLRFNTTSGKADVKLSSIISPYASTGCQTEGTLPTTPSSSAGEFLKPPLMCDAFTSQAECPSCLEAQCCEELDACLKDSACVECISAGFVGCAAGQAVLTCGQAKCGGGCPP